MILPLQPPREWVPKPTAATNMNSGLNRVNRTGGPHRGLPAEMAPRNATATYRFGCSPHPLAGDRFSLAPAPGRKRLAMHLEFTDEQLELRDSARAALGRECPPRLVRTSPRAAPAWTSWPPPSPGSAGPHLTIEVDLGGLGRGFVELAMLLEEMGRAAAPGPFLPTQALFAPVVREAGTTAQAHRFLAGVAAGASTGTLALHEGGRWDPLTVVATAERDGDGWLLRGHKQHVLGAPDVDEVVVAARRDSGTLGLFVVPAAGAHVQAHDQPRPDPVPGQRRAQRRVGAGCADAGRARRRRGQGPGSLVRRHGGPGPRRAGRCAPCSTAAWPAAHDGRIARGPGHRARPGRHARVDRDVPGADLPGRVHGGRARRRLPHGVRRPRRPSASASGWSPAPALELHGTPIDGAGATSYACGWVGPRPTTCCSARPRTTGHHRRPDAELPPSPHPPSWPPPWSD